MPCFKRGIFFAVYFPLKKITIKEHSLLARIAARALRTNNVAIVLGRTIYLHNTTIADFTANKKWLLHELKHVKQYEEKGVLKFLFLYLLYSARYGYHNNPFEAEARHAETDDTLLKLYDISAYTNKP